MLVLSRAAGAVTARPQISQEITVIPTRLTSLDNVIESAMRVAEFIKRKIDTTRQLVTTSDIGCPRIVVDKVYYYIFMQPCLFIQLSLLLLLLYKNRFKMQLTSYVLL